MGIATFKVKPEITVISTSVWDIAEPLYKKTEYRAKVYSSSDAVVWTSQLLFIFLHPHKTFSDVFTYDTQSTHSLQGDWRLHYQTGQEPYAHLFPSGNPVQPICSSTRVDW